MILQKLRDQGLIQPPKFLPDNTAYLTIMGSMSYGVSSDNSDMDVTGFCFPPKELTFPHLGGEVPGFGRQIQRFENWQQHHIKTLDGTQEYDFSVYSIVKFFQLVMENNPNMISSLFTSQGCVIHCTNVGNIVRENRKMFLHKGSFQKFKGYAYANFNRYKDPSKREELIDIFKILKPNGINRLTSKQIDAELVIRGLKPEGSVNETISHILPETALSILSEKDLLALASEMNGLSKRGLSILEIGYDSKAMYHVVRLLAEVEQILTEHDLDLMRNREQLKSIRRGEWTMERLENFFTSKEKSLEDVCARSTLRATPDEKAIKELLLQCLEEHYGSLTSAIARDVSAERVIAEMQAVLDKYA